MNANVASYRKPEAEQVADIFVERWSPRAMKPEPLTAEDLRPLFEAARWAPSSYNNQPWRFVYALRGTPAFERFQELLEEGNRGWAQHAGALVVMLSKKTFDFNGKLSRTHTFDAGAAWACFALQGSMRGLNVHGMQGFDYEKARETVGAPEELEVEAMAAMGKPGRKEDLPERARDMEKPSGRKKLAEIAFEGRLG